MNVNDLTQAIITGINNGGEQFLEGTLAAVLPVMWLAILGLHLGRPYILDMIDRFTLRLGADLLWLIYVALRDLLIVSGVIISFMFFFPDVVLADQLPLTGGLAAVTLFGVLLVKLMGDPDHNLRDFRIVTYLLALGSIFYFVPYVFGVQLGAQANSAATSVAAGTFFESTANFLVTSSNPYWALGMAYTSVACLAILGAVAAIYAIRTGGRANAAEAETAK